MHTRCNSAATINKQPGHWPGCLLCGALTTKRDAATYRDILASNAEEFQRLARMVSDMLFLLDHEECSGIFNGTAPHPVSNREFSQTLATTLHRPHLFFVPAPLLQLVMGEAADLLLTGQKVIPARLQQAGFHFSYPELPSALANLLREPR